MLQISDRFVGAHTRVQISVKTQFYTKRQHSGEIVYLILFTNVPKLIIKDADYQTGALNTDISD